MSKITDVITELAEPVVKAQGCELWDVEYVREAGEWFLRVYIDKDGGVGIADCEAFSRAVDPVLDEADPIRESYFLEVSSPGLGRSLTREEHFAAMMGRQVRVHTIRPVEGERDFVGALAAYDGGVTLETEDGVRRLEKSEIASVKLNDDADLF